MHIPEHKEETCHLPVRKIDGAPVHIYPLQQHIGARCEPTVAVGDYVTVGQVIADSDAFLISWDLIKKTIPKRYRFFCEVLFFD